MCKTKWYPEYKPGTKWHTKESVNFHCTMQIDNDVNRTLYKKEPDIYWFSHPEFGVDELTDETMKIDILVDEKNCRANLGRDNINAPDHFRELEEPNIWQKIF